MLEEYISSRSYKGFGERVFGGGGGGWQLLVYDFPDPWDFSWEVLDGYQMGMNWCDIWLFLQVRSQRLSIGMIPKTLRLPKPGEMLLSVHGSPLGVYKEDNMEAIHGMKSIYIFSCSSYWFLEKKKKNLLLFMLSTLHWGIMLAILFFILFY